ncbi:hypothetical protein VTN00DRAFT_8797 [Thermoascus crustaceus]|uniref:uncharacterized protein n=1 Tax=Thermoascus crustaceus TaxID=5088 RepID=UPI003743C9E9
MAVLTPLFEPEASKPKSRLSEIGSNAVLLNNFHLSTLVLLGCTLQGLLTYSLLHHLHLPTLSLLSLLPSICILTYRSLDVLLIMYGWRKNQYMEDIIPGRVSAQVPDEKGEFGTEPSRETVVVLFLGLRTNHPLGILSPGFNKMKDLFIDMTQDMEERREEFEFLGTTSWLSISDRTTSSELLNIYYFRSMSGLHRFAHAKYHSRGMVWWATNKKYHPDISIMHETYEARPGCWENVYVNYHRSGFASVSYPVKVPLPLTPENGNGPLAEDGGEDKKEVKMETRWISPLVDASKPDMRTRVNRMGRDEKE